MRRRALLVTKKVALLLVASLAPFTFFSQAEAALLYGVYPKTVAKRKAALPPNALNIGK